jgi:copper transport protein
LLILIPLLTLTMIINVGSVSAHAALEKASPAPDALLATPPQNLDLRFTERVDTGAGSPSIEIVDTQGNRTVADARVDPDDPRHVIATTDAIGSGTYTVAWSVRSLDDGHTLAGSYAFRVGGADRAPGAATTAGERPQECRDPLADVPRSVAGRRRCALLPDRPGGSATPGESAR